MHKCGSDFLTKFLDHSSSQRIAPFLVGAFPLREKCPTIAVTVFFLQTTILTLIGRPVFRNNPETT